MKGGAHVDIVTVLQAVLIVLSIVLTALEIRDRRNRGE
jgi:hypothetical protein